MMINTIRSKLTFFSFASILVTLFVVGISFDLLLRTQYQQRARAEILHSYDFVNSQLKSFEGAINEQAHQLANDESIIAAVNLINRYQDPDNYQPLVFDPEKKGVATHLLRQIAASSGMVGAIYDKHGALLVYVTQSAMGSIPSISSIQDGNKIFLAEDKKSGIWLPTTVADSLTTLHPVTHNPESVLVEPSSLVYVSGDNDFTIKAYHPIRQTFRNSRVETIGYVTLHKTLGAEFLQSVSHTTSSSLSVILANGTTLNPTQARPPQAALLARSQPMGSTSLNDLMWLDHPSHYLQSYAIPASNGDIYLIIALAKRELTNALNQVRIVLLLVFIFTALILVSTGYLWLNKLVTKPLHSLIRHAREVESGASAGIPSRQTNDEIDQLSQVLNSMVSAIKEREADLTNTQRTLNEAQHIARIGSWERDHLSGTLTWSREIYNILNLDPDTRPYPEAFIEYIHPDDLEESYLARLTARNNHTACDITYRLILPELPLKHIHERTQYYFDDANRLITSSGTLQDVTEQHNKDAIVRRSQKMDALGQLTGGIAHDFNNMLGVILGFSELMMLRVDGDEKLEKYASNIHHAAERAKNMTSKLLAFSRMKPLSAEATNMNDLLHEQQHMLEKSLTARIELVFECEEALWPVYVERGGLEDAILNMSINAMHAMTESGILTLRTRNTHLTHHDASFLNLDAGDYVLLSIIDTGSGMSEETIEHLFDPFYTTKGSKGTGLGMSQVYAFVRQSGGNIHVSSQLGSGSHIDIYFPRHLAFAELTTDTERSGEVRDLTGFESILIVDDEEGILAFEQESLSPRGYEVLSARSGEQALEILARRPVDLLLSDVIMPEMNGYQLAAAVSERYPTIKIILASGYTDDSDRELASGMLHSEILKKPFTSEELLCQVRDALDGGNSLFDSEGRLEWSDAFCTGIAEIDSDHRTLVALLGKCQGMVADGADRADIASLLRELLDYTTYHFAREELLMELCHYPEFTAHQSVHQQLILQLKRRIMMFGNGTLTTHSMLNLLRHWLASHILGMDKAITPYCLGKEELIHKTLAAASSTTPLH